MTSLANAAALISGIGLLLSLAGFIAAAHFAGRRNRVLAERPPVTILKPLCGDEPLLEEALASCCAQTYPEFQIVFGVQDPKDPALAVVQRLRRRFPSRDITVVVDSTTHGPNRKVSNLINMLPQAKHDVLTVSDSDLHVAPDYLERLVAALEEPETGLVTTVFVGLPAGPGWPERLGATHISHSFLPGALLARAMGRLDCLGSTVTMRRETLERSGGLESLVHHLAEDNVLGQRVRELGLTIRLAGTVPAAIVPESSFRALWLHEIRWARTIRALAPLAFAASVLEYPLFWAAMALVLSGGMPWYAASFAGIWAMRGASAWGIDRVLRARLGRISVLPPILLFPLRDILSVVQIVASFWSDEVVWRGHAMRADRRTSPQTVRTAIIETGQQSSPSPLARRAV